MKRVRTLPQDTDLIEFTVVVEKVNDGVWEASVEKRAAYSYVAKSPYKAVRKLLKMLRQEGFLDG